MRIGYVIIRALLLVAMVTASCNRPTTISTPSSGSPRAPIPPTATTAVPSPTPTPTPVPTLVPTQTPTLTPTPTPSPTPTSTPSPKLAPTRHVVNTNTQFDLQGFNFTAWQQDGWDSKLPIEEALSFAVEEGANFLVFDYPVNFNDDGTIVSHGGLSHPAWQDITRVVRRAKELGFYVMMKPHVTMTSSTTNRNYWNTKITTFLPSSFFEDWKEYLSEVAQFSTTNSVDSLSIGTEMNFIDYLFRDEWVDLILAVRKYFSGMLTYDAIFNLSKSVKDVEDVVFWDKLDFIGVSLYIRLTKDDNASVDVLKGLWKDNNSGDIKDVVSYLKSISDKYGKQLIALEGGYQSVNGALYDVNSKPEATKVVNNDVQARGLDAYLSVLSESKGAWLKGVSLWQITPITMTPRGLQSIYHTQEFSSYKKPAAEVIKKHFKP